MQQAFAHPRQLSEAAFGLLVGKRCRLVSMLDAGPAPPGTGGTIAFVTPLHPGAVMELGCDWRQIVVRWDNGENLIVVLPADAIEVVVEHEVN